MSGDDLQGIMTEVSDALIDNQANVDMNILDLIEKDVQPLFSANLSHEDRVNRVGTMNAFDLKRVGDAIAAVIKHERTLLTPDPTTKITMTSKIVNGIASFKARTWIVAIVAKLF